MTQPRNPSPHRPPCVMVKLFHSKVRSDLFQKTVYESNLELQTLLDDGPYQELLLLAHIVHVCFLVALCFHCSRHVGLVGSTAIN